MKLSIRAKIFIGFALLLALSSLVQAFTFSITREYIYSQIGDFQLIQAKKGASEIQDFFSNLNNTTANLARIYRNDSQTSSGSANFHFDAIASNTLETNQFIKKITVLSPAGKELTKFDQKGQVPSQDLNYEISSDPFRTAVSGKTAISKVYYLEQELGPHLDIFSPIFLNNNSIMGVIKVQVDLEKLRESISDITVGEKGFVYVVDDEGRLIAHPSQSLVTQRPDMLSRRIVARALSNQQIKPEDETYQNENNVEVVAKAAKVPGINWVVVLEQPVADAFDFVTVIRNIFIVTLIGSLIVLLLLSIIISENLTRSIHSLQQYTQLLEKGHFDATVNITSGDEIESLANSFNTMAKQLLQRESSLHKEKQETETILQSLTDAVIALDENNKVILFNKTAEKLTGFSADSVLNKDINEILHLFEEEQLIPFAQYSQQTEQVQKRIQQKGLNMTNSTGVKMTVSVSVNPIQLSGQEKRGWSITFHDTTQEHELEEMKLDFVSMAAHELRTPLTAIRGYASLLNMQNAKDLDPGGKELVNRLIMSSENLANLIDNLLNVSRIEKNTFAVDARPVDLTDTIKSVVESLKQQAYTQNQRLELALQEKLPIVMADPFRIGQVLLNLVGNGLNYTPEGGTITVSAEQKGNYLQVSITDNGNGIPKDAIPKLFTKFFRVSGSLEQGSKGTGLGLFISKSIVEMHNGKIWAESEIGRGSTFTFVLPIATQEDLERYKKAPLPDLTQKNIQGIINKNNS
jgi:PAS domain S-box-containing protein